VEGNKKFDTGRRGEKRGVQAETGGAFRLLKSVKRTLGRRKRRNETRVDEGKPTRRAGSKKVTHPIAATQRTGEKRKRVLGFVFWVFGFVLGFGFGFGGVVFWVFFVIGLVFSVKKRYSLGMNMPEGRLLPKNHLKKGDHFAQVRGKKGQDLKIVPVLKVEMYIKEKNWVTACHGRGEREKSRIRGKRGRTALPGASPETKKFGGKKGTCAETASKRDRKKKAFNLTRKSRGKGRGTAGRRKKGS